MKIYETILDSLLAGETVTMHCNAYGEPVSLNTVRPRLSALYAKFRRTMEEQGIAVQARSIAYTSNPDGSITIAMHKTRPSGFRITAASADGTIRELTAPAPQAAAEREAAAPINTKPKLELSDEQL